MTLKRRVQLEKLFGADFLPVSKTELAKRAPKAAAPAPAKPAAAKPAPPKRASLVPIVGRVELPPDMAELREEIEACTRCTTLCTSRTQTVFGVGTLTTPLLFIGEAPGEDEDIHGEPFVGRAGQLLTQTLEKIGVKRAQIYIANILKCRPPGNRTPDGVEMANCTPYLQRQIDFIKPTLICLMGNVALKGLLGTTRGITSMRGAFTQYMGTRVLPTFHPAYVLRNMTALPTFEGDLKLACKEAGLLP
jgi:DNA polymerase